MIRMLLPVILTAVCVFLWIDSEFAVRRLPLIPAGELAMGLKSEGGWLSWNMFMLWDELNDSRPIPSCFSRDRKC